MSTHGLQVRVSGRDITVSGLADSSNERDQILTALNGIPGRRVVNDNIRILPVESPFTSFGERQSDGSVAMAGFAPSDAARRDLDGVTGARNLALASGAPVDWALIVTRANAAMAPLNEARWELSDTNLRMMGTAATSDERAQTLAVLDSLPDGVTVDTDIALVLDDAALSALIRAAAERIVAGADHGATVTVNGRDVTITGLAGSPDERDALIAALQGIGRVGTVIDDLRVLDRISPFTTSALKSDGGLSMRGHVPSELARGLVGDAAAGLDLATGAPAGWIDAVALANGALSRMIDGDWQLSDTALTLRGTVLDPAARNAVLAALGKLPDGFDLTTNLQMLDDGAPPAFDLTYTAANGAVVAGKLPFGMDAAAVARALGLTNAQGTPQTALVDNGQAGAVTAALAELGRWLPQTETAKLGWQDGVLVLDAVFGPGADVTQITAQMQDRLPGAIVKLRYANASELPPDDTLRNNAATGQDERFAGGFWLPVLEPFDPTPANCEARGNAMMQAVQINFVTGSATLDAASLDDINRITSLMRVCVVQGGLRAIVGGHTDDVGSDQANQLLSLDRAWAVRQALIARGIPGEAVEAEGYGETRPIADNATEAGRAANRRTTIEWTDVR
ncbi:OmpA family protein [Mesobacterium sp. TK19101]|uniref:OmpA family protein n=1 Tax=Mesobacterium hydrothermale TaxID=3111907 RepID=A0ABU6HEK0_9RHOB|nr:OmpA family protein [Mesobacterium sp. TK19101]MEC3860079.1 OmpA family protein [Mesobacterium sp. TK19101]